MTPNVAPVVTVAVWFRVIRLLAAKTSPTPPIIANASGITKRLAIFKSLPDTLGYRRLFKLKNIQNELDFPSVFCAESFDIRDWDSTRLPFLMPIACKS